MENYFFIKNSVTPEGAVSHSVLYYQTLPITRYQVRFHADNYFELPIVFTAFNYWTQIQIILSQLLGIFSNNVSARLQLVLLTTNI